MHQTHKDNHYVPKLYLKNWAVDGKIKTYRLLVPTSNYPLWKTQSLKGIAYQEHLYAYISAGERKDEFERWFDRDFEAPAKLALSRAITDGRLTADDWRHLIRFAFAQDVRTPARLRDFISRQSSSLQILLDETLAEAVKKLEAGVQISDVAMKADDTFPLHLEINPLAEGGGILRARTMVGRRLWLWVVRHMLSETIKQVPMKGWTILRAPEGVSWPTSDNPLIRLNYWNPQKYNFGGGWKVPKGDILLPLSPTHLMYKCEGEHSMMRGSTLDKDTALVIKKIIIEHADRYIFSVDQEGIHEIRPRTISVERYEEERRRLREWDREQSAAEATFKS